MRIASLLTCVAGSARAEVAVDAVGARSFVLARIAVTLVDVSSAVSP